MNAAVIGLGLIGGSFARAIKEYTDFSVVGFDRDMPTLLAAKTVGAIDAVGDAEALSDCDMTVISLYPQATVEFLRDNAASVKKGSVVVDTCGVKASVCRECGEIARENGFYFIGGHPMAGTQYSGFSHSRATMFKGATMILCPEQGEDIPTVERTRDFFLSLSFSAVHFTSPEEHDRMIAYTSQLAHVVSNAYVKSPRAQTHKGFSAGSYRDLTRVARLNPDMWTELFLDNRDALVTEIDTLIDNLKVYSDALKNGDAEALRSALAEGCALKISAENG